MLSTRGVQVPPSDTKCLDVNDHLDDGRGLNLEELAFRGLRDPGRQV